MALEGGELLSGGNAQQKKRMKHLLDLTEEKQNPKLKNKQKTVLQRVEEWLFGEEMKIWRENSCKKLASKGKEK